MVGLDLRSCSMAERITSLQNTRVKQAVHLRDARQRQKQGRFLIDGVRELTRAVEAGMPLLEVFVCREQCTTDEGRRAIELLEQTRAMVCDVTPPVYEKLRFGGRCDGLVAVARTIRRSPEELVLPADPLIAVIEGLEKPGNLGAILRSADAAGVSAVVVADGGTDLYNPNAIRASLGTIFTLPIAQATATDTLNWLRQQKLPIYAARVDANLEYTQAELSGGAAVVLGSEALGLSDVWRAGDVTGLRLPMHGAADSLNVSATAAVLFYEAVRQRTRR